MEHSGARIRKRVPIRRRFLRTVLLTTIISILAVSITGFICIQWNRNAMEETLTEQLEINLKNVIQEKVGSIDAKLRHYERYIEFVRDTIGGMYADEAETLALGKMVNPPRDTHEYELTRAFATPKLTEAELHDEILFYSVLEHAWEPIAKENEDIITTLYLGTKDGLLVSYDKYSYLSCPPEGLDLIYNYYGSDWYKSGMKEDGVFFTDVYMDSQGRGLTITIGSPFVDGKGEFAGVTCMDFDLTTLYDDLFSVDLDNNAFTFALDRRGTIILPDSSTLDLQEYTGLTLDDLDALKADPDGLMEKNDSVYVCIPMERVGWTLCACVPKSAIQKTIHEADRSIINAFMVFLAIALLILLAAVIAVNRSVKSVTYPLELLGKDIKVISNGDLLYRATVYRNDEIGDITSGMNEMVDRLNFTLNELTSSQQHADAMSRLATQDPLTGMRNKMAFDEQSRILNEQIEQGRGEFGLAMIDLNNLKIINDNYGHEKGDITIRKLCETITDIFAHSPVFRVGGDEFVVVLQGEDYENAEVLLKRFKDTLGDMSRDEMLSPWDSVSAAVGYAKYDKTKDLGAESVLARADKEMYACKKAMKGGR